MSWTALIQIWNIYSEFTSLLVTKYSIHRGFKDCKVQALLKSNPMRCWADPSPWSVPKPLLHWNPFWLLKRATCLQIYVTACFQFYQKSHKIYPFLARGRQMRTLTFPWHVALNSESQKKVMMVILKNFRTRRHIRHAKFYQVEFFLIANQCSDIWEFIEWH